jgi:hypothetical protein
MKDCLIIDISYPDDVFLINVRVEPLVDPAAIKDEKVYQLTYELDRKFIGILEFDKDVSGCKMTGKVKLTDFQMKMIHEGITETFEAKKFKKPYGNKKSARIW